MNELPVIGATGQTLQLAKIKCMVKGCFDVL